MARQDANENFLNTAFLYGANASYIEELQARYEKDPGSVDPEWQAFFGALKDDKQAVEKAANGPSWEKQNWPIHANGELISMPLREAREHFERAYLQAQLQRFGGNISRTANFVGMERSAPHRKLKTLGLHGDD